MFNNKFSRLLPHPGYNIGGGIGEAALLGAAFGGGKALVTGENILEGALIGGTTGAVTGGIFGGPGSDVAATTVADEVKNQATEAALTGGVGIGNFGVNEGVRQSLTDMGAYGAKDFMSAVDPGGLNAALNVAPQATQSAGIAAINPNATSMMQNLGTTAAPIADVAQLPVELGTEVFNPALAQQELLKQAAYNPTQTTGIRGMLDVKPGSMTSKALDFYDRQDTLSKAGMSALGGAAVGAAMGPGLEMPEEEEYKGPLSKFKYDPNKFSSSRIVPNVYQSRYAQGGIAALAGGSYPMGRQDNTQFATPTQMPTSAELIRADYEPVEMAVGGMAGLGDRIDARGNYVPSFNIADIARGQMLANTAPPPHNPLANFRPTRNINAQRPAARQIYKPKYAEGGIAEYNLGGYAAGGNPRLLKGPGDGMSDDIPATIANKQPARLADGEFVVPADVVSHLGNGSTDAGAKHLYAMMDKVRKARTGSKKQGKQIKPAKFMPA